jgi:hypothetical protein
MDFWIVFLSELIDKATCREGESKTSTNFIHTFPGAIIDGTSNFFYLIERCPEKEVIVSARSREDNDREF